MVLISICITPVAGNTGERIVSHWRTIRDVQISGDQVVWAEGYSAMFESEPFRIVRYDILRKEWVNLTPKTGNFESSIEPDISSDQIVWQGDSGIGGPVFLHEITTNMTRIIHPGKASHPRISGDLVAWENIGNYEIEWGEFQIPPVIRNVIYRDPPCLSVHNLRTGEEYTIPLASHTEQRTLSLDNGRLVWDDILNGTWRVFLHDAGSRTTREVTDSPGGPAHPQVSGDWMVWMDTRNNGDIVLYHIPTGTTKYIAAGPEAKVLPRISGERILWVERTGENLTIRQYNSVTGGSIPIVEMKSSRIEYDVSGDRMIYLTRNETSRQDELYLLNLPEGKVEEPTITTMRLPATGAGIPGFLSVSALGALAIIVGLRRWQ